MPADKDAAKRRRKARNRQERQNRQARTEGAKRAATRPSRTATETPTKGAKGSKGTATTSLAKTPTRTPAASGGLLGKLFPPRPEPSKGGTEGRPARAARPPSEVVEVEGEGPRGLLLRLTAQPGGRAVVLALLVGVVFSVTLLFFPVLPSTDLSGYSATVARSQVEAEGGDDDALDEALAELDTTSLGTVRGIEYPPPGLYLALLITLIPTMIGIFAVRSLTKPTRSRTLLVCAIAGVLFFVTNLGPGLYYVLGVIALCFGAYQSSKADKLALADAA